MVVANAFINYIKTDRIFFIEMKPSKHRQFHPCKKHHSVRARGRCVHCGTWICKECSVLIKGRFFCSDTCTGKKTFVATSVIPKPSTQINPERAKGSVVAISKKTQSRRFIGLPIKTSHIAGAAALLLGLIGVTFGIISFLQLSTLREKTEALERVNSTLIHRLKQREELIESLRQNQSDSIITHPETKPQPKRAFGIVAKPIGQLPLNVTSGPSEGALIALTFDGSAFDNIATAILDTLSSRNVLATMFISGEFMRKHPQTLKNIVAAGHEIGNHTRDHPHLTSWADNQQQITLSDVSPEMIRRELKGADELMVKITGQHMAPIWRAPYGEINDQICGWAQQCGYLHVGWQQARTFSQNFDTNDWVTQAEDPGYYPPQVVYDKFVAMAQSGRLNGGIILMHLGTTRKDPAQQVHTILGRLIDTCKASGYTFVTVSQMLAAMDVDASILEKYRE